MKAHSALLNILFYVNLTLCTQRLHIRRQMVNRPGQTFCITHSPLFLKCCEQGNSNNPFPRLSFHPWPWQSSGSRAIPKPLQLKWHVPNGNPIVYVRAMSPFSWILFGPSGRICGTQLVSKLKRNFSPCSICIYFSSPLELVRDWESASGSEEDTASPAWKELGLRHPLCYSWETDLCSQTPLGAKQWSQQLYRQLGFGAMLKISALTWGFWKDPQDGLAVVSTGSALSLWPNWHSASHLGGCCHCCSKIVSFHNELHCFLLLSWINNCYSTS